MALADSLRTTRHRSFFREATSDNTLLRLQFDRRICQPDDVKQPAAGVCVLQHAALSRNLTGVSSSLPAPLQADFFLPELQRPARQVFRRMAVTLGGA